MYKLYNNSLNINELFIHYNNILPFLKKFINKLTIQSMSPCP
jgi:hypothetical protein